MVNIANHLLLESNLVCQRRCHIRNMKTIGIKIGIQVVHTSVITVKSDKLYIPFRFIT